MKQTLFAVLLTLTFVYNASAQKRTYTFDYSITMLEDFKYDPSTKSKNTKELVSTWLNSKDKSYIAKIYYNADSSRNRISITDFDNNRFSLMFLHDKEGKHTFSKPLGSEGGLIYKISEFKPIEPDSMIGKYVCQRFMIGTQSDIQFIDAWFTRDITDAPAHAMQNAIAIGVAPAQYSGIPVWYRLKSPVADFSFKLVSAFYIKHKVGLKGKKLVLLEEDTKSMLN